MVKQRPSNTRSPDEVSRYYDDYAGRQVAVGVNERHRRIMGWLAKAGSHARSRVLEIGCGVGTQTELMAQVVTEGRILAIDISPKSVEIARKRLAGRSQVEFIAGDILELALQGPFDLIVLPDVLEHIPKADHAALFGKLARLLAPEGTIVVHIPSPQHIEWLQRHHPEKLQVIDQPIHLAELVPKLADAGLYLRSAEHYALWTTSVDAAVLFIERYSNELPFAIAPLKRPVTTRIKERLSRPKAGKVTGPDGRGTQEAVLFIVDWWPLPSNPHYGVYVREHAIALSRHRRVVVVRVTMEKARTAGVTYHESSDGDLLVCDAVVRFPARRFGLHDALVRRSYRRVLDDLGDRFHFSVAHVHVRTPPTTAFLQVAQERGLPVVITEHSTYYHTGINTGVHGEPAEVRKRIATWFAHPSVKKVLPVSEDLARTLMADYGVPGEKIEVVPNVASTLFVPGEIGPPPPFRIVLAARWSGNKDPMTFMDALERLPADIAGQLEIDWIGDGSFMDAVQERARALKDRVNIRFLGYQSKAEVAKHLGRAHLLVHPTKAENLPCIIIESLACGTPVLSHAVNGVPELVDGTNGVLCRPGDVQEFADSLERIISGQITFDRRAIAAAASEHFSEDSVARQLMRVYEEVVSAGDPDRSRAKVG
ncbi:MAG: glycosyltransferase [Flavobacteriales bacterium]|nr:glycosyltransferase [Flavobacteriales bacterium]